MLFGNVVATIWVRLHQGDKFRDQILNTRSDRINIDSLHAVDHPMLDPPLDVTTVRPLVTTAEWAVAKPGSGQDC